MNTLLPVLPDINMNSINLKLAFKKENDKKYTFIKNPKF